MFIWLSPEHYPEYQKKAPNQPVEFCIAEFRKEIMTPSAVSRIELDVFADVTYSLWCNNRFIGNGPVATGHEMKKEPPTLRQYTNHYTLHPACGKIVLYAEVNPRPLKTFMYEISHGKPCFWLSAKMYLNDGTKLTLETDETWDCRVSSVYSTPFDTDFTRPEQPWTKAVGTESVWNLFPSPIPNLTEEKIYPNERGSVTVAPHEASEFTVEFDRIYAAHPAFQLNVRDNCTVTLEAKEQEDLEGFTYNIKTNRSVTYRSRPYGSIGMYRIRIENNGDRPVVMSDIHAISTHYPDKDESLLITSDERINKLYEVGKHTLQICRQTLHLDSPKHCEPLICPGDYMIESLMAYMTFGDARLTRFDIERIADIIRKQDGVMFHPTYSMFWVQMLYDYYMYTGDISILRECDEAIQTLMRLFHSYLGDNGLIEKAPSYMFVDWIGVDGYSLHHPPKALGQTVLCACYHQGLRLCEKIYLELGNMELTQLYKERADALKIAFHEQLYVPERGLFKDGLNTPNQVPEGEWLPPNNAKVYFSKQANILAVLYGLCKDEAQEKELLCRVMTDDSLTDYQPYFAHFLLDAVVKTDTFDKYGMGIIARWFPMIEASPKGLAEGWISPPNYIFDHSHAWGGTPVYQLPRNLLGLKIIEPGLKKISLKPQLFGLEYADVQIPTPYGNIRVTQRKGSEPIIYVPNSIETI